MKRFATAAMFVVGAQIPLHTWWQWMLCTLCYLVGFALFNEWFIERSKIRWPH